MKNTSKFNFIAAYEVAELIDSSVGMNVELWNYSEEHFAEAAASFSKDTLLHQYIVTTSLNYYERDFRKNSEEIDVEKWYYIFKEHGIKIKRKKKAAECNVWLEENINEFEELFEKIAEEVFYIMFGNRRFLLEFNVLISETVKNTKFPPNALSAKGTIKRKNIPEWVKKAVFHRDKGRCVFCNTDLTNLINTESAKNFDHILPLDLYGTNDPCNIQLLCERCNKIKSNKPAKTSDHYIPWWRK